MSNQAMQDELHHLQGALEALDLMRERLLFQRDEMGPENGLEAVDEMLTQVDALQLEFQHRLEKLDLS